MPEPTVVTVMQPNNARQSTSGHLGTVCSKLTCVHMNDTTTMINSATQHVFRVVGLSTLSIRILCMQCPQQTQWHQDFQCWGHSERSCQLSIGVGSDVVRRWRLPKLCLAALAPASGVVASSALSCTARSVLLSVS